MTNLYQSDVRLMPDAELKTLSDELYEAYGRGDDWTDDAAGTRYHELLDEIRRRWYLEHPEYAKGQGILSPNIIAKAALSALENTLTVARSMRADLNRGFKA